MQVVCLEDGVELRNVSEETDDNGQKHEVVLGRMPITSENIPTFIATMAAASAGRTSIGQIKRAISQAHFVDLNK